MTTEIVIPLRPRILVVDDDVAIGGTIKRYLRNYDIALADSVESALDQLGREAYDLLLLDRRLPDGLGDHVVEDVRRKRGSLPIIMMSGEVLPRSVDDRARHQPDDFIEKPFVREALIAKIDRLLTAHAVRQQTRRQRAELAELHERRDREVDVARTIFDRIFARGEFEPTRVRHLVRAADRLAGDVVFGAWADGGRYRWMIGDVTGHTLSSALVTMALAGIFYPHTRERQSMSQVLAELERELAAILPSSMFCVAAMCELDRAAGVLQIWNGGSPDILIRHARGGLTRIPATGVPLAADRFAEPSHPLVEHPVEPGDRILAFSDGLIELRDGHHGMLGFDHMLKIACTGPIASVFERLCACIPDSGAVDDDISLVEVVV